MSFFNWLRGLLKEKKGENVAVIFSATDKPPSPEPPRPLPEPPPTPAFPFPVEIVHGSQALAAFDRLKKAGRGSPVILGNDEELAAWAESIVFNEQHGRSLDKALLVAKTLSFPRDLRNERERERREFLKRHPEYENDEDVDIGDWPDEAPEAPQLTVAYDILTGKPFEQVYIALIPTNDPTEIPAYLHAGDWNENPSAAHHIAALRSWRDRYGAELVAMSHDVINMRVARRPKDRDEAMALAREQFDYCEDVVLQGTNTLSALAASLMEADWWYFWWD